MIASVHLLILRVFIWWALSIKSHERFFLYFRSIDTTTGLSPLVPISLVGAAMFGIGIFWLRQTCLHRDKRLLNPYSLAWKGLREADDALNSVLGGFSKTGLATAAEGGSQNRIRLEESAKSSSETTSKCNPISAWLSYSLPFSVILAVPFFIDLIRNVFIVPQLPSSEGLFWDRSMTFLFWVTAFLVLLTLIQFLAAWRKLSLLLKEILRVPMVSAFEALPCKIRHLFRGYLFSQEKIRFQHIAAAAWTLPVSEREVFFDSLKDAQLDQLSWAKSDENHCNPNDLKKPDEILERAARSLNDYASQFLQELPSYWQPRPIDAALGSDARQDSESKTETHNASVQQLADGRNAEKERYVAAFVVLYLGIYFAQLRMLAYALVFGAPLLLIAGASYPFQPDRPQLFSLMALLAAVAGSITYVLYQMNINALISRIMRTPPDRFTPDLGFLSSIATYVLPLLTVIVLHLLGLIRFIVEPIVSLLQ